MIQRLGPILALVLALGGCGGLLGGGPPPELYEVRTPADLPQARSALARDLVIEVPETGAALDTNRIMIRPNPLQAQYLPRAAWTGSAPVMLQSVMVNAFNQTGAFRFVGRRPLGASADFALVSDLADFQAEVVPDQPGAMVRVRLTARLVRESDAQVLAGRTFQQTVQTGSTDSLAVARAFDVATAAMLRELTAWVLGRVGAGPAS